MLENINLFLFQGERLSILRQLDADWVEVRSRNGEGAVPSSYIQPITNEYDDDVIRSVSSRTVTPIFGGFLLLILRRNLNFKK